jgi:PadR family transcriptional regulator PadR
LDAQLKKGLLEICVLAYLQHGDSYGYELVKNISPLLPISESTLYPILKRLEASRAVETYNKSHQGRTRKYYRLTKLGKQRIDDFLTNDWPQLTLIQRFIKGGTLDEQS